MCQDSQRQKVGYFTMIVCNLEILAEVKEQIGRRKQLAAQIIQVCIV